MSVTDLKTGYSETYTILNHNRHILILSAIHQSSWVIPSSVATSVATTMDPHKYWQIIAFTGGEDVQEETVFTGESNVHGVDVDFGLGPGLLRALTGILRGIEGGGTVD
jgi:hypothetical protein